MTRVSLLLSELVLLELVDEYKVYSKAQSKNRKAWQDILKRYNRRIHTKIPKYDLLIKKFEGIVNKYKTNAIPISHRNRPLIDKIIKQYDAVEEVQNTVSLDILIPLINSYQPSLFGFNNPNTSWRFILKKYNNI